MVITKKRKRKRKYNYTHGNLTCNRYVLDYKYNFVQTSEEEGPIFISIIKSHQPTNPYL